MNQCYKFFIFNVNGWNDIVRSMTFYGMGSLSLVPGKHIDFCVKGLAATKTIHIKLINLLTAISIVSYLPSFTHEFVSVSSGLL